MLPRFPDRLHRIDGALLPEHSRLVATDHCDFLWEYIPHRRANWTAANQLIRNLKLKHSQLALRPSRLRYKRAAIAHAARGLRRLLPPGLVREATFVPMPCSKARVGCEHDDRMVRVLHNAFAQGGADIRELLHMQRSLAADHESRERCSPARLRSALCVGGAEPRRIIILVDDVLNSGKHFRVASALLNQRWPDRQIRGLFLARCVRGR